MITRILSDLLLFLMPFTLYGVYWWFSGRKADADSGSHPWVYLSAAGLVLVALSFVVWSIPAEETRGGVYVPPHIEDGRVVPGHVQPRGNPP